MPKRWCLPGAGQGRVRAEVDVQLKSGRQVHHPQAGRGSSGEIRLHGFVTGVGQRGLRWPDGIEAQRNEHTVACLEAADQHRRVGGDCLDELKRASAGSGDELKLATGLDGDGPLGWERTGRDGGDFRSGDGFGGIVAVEDQPFDLGADPDAAGRCERGRGFHLNVGPGCAAGRHGTVSGSSGLRISYSSVRDFLYA